MNIGNYELIRQISEGSFGRTYLARHRLLGLPVCLKQEKTGDPVYMDLFAKEAALLYGISHSSLPTLKDYLELEDEGQIMVMSFVEGENLADLVEKRGPADDEHACWIIQRALDALSYLHWHRIIHSDIKPENIIIDVPAHNATLVDFGLAAVVADARVKPKGGTEFYMPPEFLLGLPPIPASDLYSLGRTAVFLTGGDPRNGTLPPDMNRELAEIISTMIRQDPNARPQDAAALNQQLTSLRRRVFGRTATHEAYKNRNGEIS